MADELLPSVRLLTFDGKRENFQMWWIRFQAFVSVKNYDDALEVNPVIPASRAVAEALHATSVNNNASLRVYKKNKLSLA